jgi:cation:H+ antiporter
VPPLLAIAVGLAVLVLGGELLVRGAVRLAARVGVSQLVIGLTVVAFGTSAPELAVSIQAVRTGAGDLALGNIVGSNIFNVLGILGVSALLVPLLVARRLVWTEVPFMVAVSLLAFGLAFDGRLAPADGFVLLGCAAAYTGWLLNTSARDETSDREGGPPSRSVLGAGLTVLVGLAALVAGARLLVDGAVRVASALGVSDAVVGLTVVAAGTSLPEAATSVMAAVRGQRDIAIGNIVGSNIFNLTVILGSTAAIGGGLAVGPGVLSFDFVVMVAVAVACLPIVFTGHVIDRWEGALFLGYYVAYTVYLVLDATGHEMLPQYRDALVWFALPLTAVTLAVVVARAARLER